jgi:hypothetical protein
MGTAIVRYLTAFVVLVYGFAKVNGSQFTILDSELDKPMGQVSGFWLTWYYFGYSKFYGNFVAFAQIAGAVLLTFRRTTLLGACVLAPIFANIVLIDVFYGVDPGATLVAVVLLVVLLGLLSGHFKELIELFWTRRASGSSWAALQWALRIGMVGVAAGFTYWVANYNNRAPSPIDGAWEVVRVEPESASGSVPRTMFFEYNRAHLSVFKFSDNTYVTHHFEANPNGKTLEIWEEWLSKGSRVFKGSYALEGGKLSLRGNLDNRGDVAMELERKKVR